MFEVRRSLECAPDGMGCFATRPIAAGTLICRFTGPLYSRDEMIRRIKAGLVRTPDDPLEVGPGIFMEVGEPFLSFNHSCDPNALLMNEADLTAIRDITVDDEITYDYSMTTSADNDWVMAIACRCGSRRCRGSIGNVLTVPEAQRRYYLRYGIQTFMRQALAGQGAAR